MFLFPERQFQIKLLFFISNNQVFFCVSNEMQKLELTMWVVIGWHHVYQSGTVMVTQNQMHSVL